MERILTTFDGWIDVIILKYDEHGILYRKNDRDFFIPYTSIYLVDKGSL